MIDSTTIEEGGCGLQDGLRPSTFLFFSVISCSAFHSFKLLFETKQQSFLSTCSSFLSDPHQNFSFCLARITTFIDPLNHHPLFPSNNMRYSTRIIIFLALSVTSVTSSPMSVNLNALATQAVSISPRNTANDKRGLVYDYLSADYAKMFVGSKSSFGSNWHGTRDETGPTLPTSFNFIPTLTVDKNLKNDQWIDTTQSIIKGGAKFVFAYVSHFPPLPHPPVSPFSFF